MKKLVLIIVLLGITNIYAQDYDPQGPTVDIDGFNYCLNNEEKVAEVSGASILKSELVIPRSISYQGTEYDVTSIGVMAFNDCTDLISVTIPNSVTSIGEMAFLGCKGLNSVTIPNSVISIGSSAFDGCTSLTSVTIGNRVEKISDSVFQGCSRLTTVTIPNSVTTIDSGAFQDCTSLKTVTIPNSVTIIDNDAFSGCINLTSLTIPNSVKTIGVGAFYHCNHLKDVYCYATTVPELYEGRWDEVFENITLHVPTESMADYNKYESWKSFKAIVAMKSDISVGREKTNITNDEADDVWVAIGTLSLLKDLNIIDAESNRLTPNTWNKNFFTKLNVRLTNSFKLNSNEASIMSTHPSDSYDLYKGSDGNYELKIKDSQSFWSLSKYLVILVK